MRKILLFSIVIILFGCSKDDGGNSSVCSNSLEVTDKINGGSILQTWKLVHGRNTASEDIIRTIDLVQKTNASWVSLSPGIGISDKSEQFPPVRYEFPVSAEIEKMKVIIPKIINSGITNIMLKPLTSFGDIGVNNSGFWGDFYVDTEEKWKEVESAYTDLFYEFANLSNEFPEVKLLSVGNELKEFTTRRPEFFKVLILKIKADFPDLQLTYAANWNEYQSVSFWDDLDFIGVNPYFPLINKETPTVDEVKQALVPIKNDLTELSCSNQKPILFTEYGYRSIDFGAWEAWNLGDVTTSNHNFETQNNAYIAFYDVFWGEDWVAGGFFWEWKVLFNGEVNNPNENGWTINDKPVEEIIRDQYKG